MDRLHDENKLLRETITCPNYVIGSSSKVAINEHQLRIENAKLKAEVFAVIKIIDLN